MANSFLVQCSERRWLDFAFHCIDVRPTGTRLHCASCAALGEAELERMLVFSYLLPLDNEFFGPQFCRLPLHMCLTPATPLE